jgi:hypothetical protein
VRLHLTVEPPANDAERLVKEIVDGGAVVDFEWLVERISDILYRAELRQGGGAVDIGIWGPAIFSQEAVRVLSGVRLEFAYPVGDEGAAGQSPGDEVKV